MKLSVLIPTLGREQEVIDTVTALGEQTVAPDEIVVVDQNQPELPRLSAVLAGVPRLKHLRFRTKGVSLNYNRCLEAATGDLVLFLDDDVRLDPRLVERHLANYREDPRIGGVAGRVEQPSGDLDPAAIREIGRYHPWSGTVAGNFNARRRDLVQAAPGGNMSFRREALLQAGGFDLGFDGNGYFFETDMSLRVHRAGWKIVFDPEATLVHLMAPRGGARMTDKAAHTYYFAKNGIRMARRHSPALAQPWIAARMALYSLAKAGYNLQPGIFARGVRGIVDGYAQSPEVIGLSSEQQRSQD